jgi:hypothetical protein
MHLQKLLSMMRQVVWLAAHLLRSLQQLLHMAVAAPLHHHQHVQATVPELQYGQEQEQVPMPQPVGVEVQVHVRRSYGWSESDSRVANSPLDWVRG